MKRVIAVAVLMMGVAGMPAYAADENNVAAGLTAAGAPLGLHGVDPVAFIDIGNRVEGSAKYTAVHNGVAYYFQNEENKAKFEKSAKKYTPQNGGFCTFGVSVGKKFDGDPQYADVVDGKLYVFLNEDIYKEYQKNPKKTISTAKKQWKKIEHTAATAL
ncbi:hypothetical protein EYS14_09565 [Alteromonadaceae bacterium M269]|nr:hypothetical protein EYS14_19810 [Alteromonadaceae bacterium M269]TDF39741.1 hypothetical protein EYS14_09565 [Alteromonadaceae bacterium M269]